MELTPEQWQAIDEILSEGECVTIISDKHIIAMGDLNLMIHSLKNAIVNDIMFGNVVGAAHHLLAAEMSQNLVGDTVQTILVHRPPDDDPTVAADVKPEAKGEEVEGNGKDTGSDGSLCDDGSV